MQKTPEIEFQNVSVSFNETPALKNVSFTLEPGELIVLTGVSGSGKSVLLHLAIALLIPDEGEILIQGEEIDKLKEEELLAVRGGSMGMVFQEESLFTGLSVYDNVAYRLTEHGWKGDQIEKAVNEVLRFVGLEAEGEKLPAELSGGMKRRVEIARALVGWPSIMLFDEPTLSLDPIVAVQVLDLIMRARDINHISSLYVTKKLHEIPYLANYRAEKDEAGVITVQKAPKEHLPKTRVIVLESGSIVFNGSVEEFETSDHPAIKNLRALDHHDHTTDPYFSDPWDKKRKPKEEILSSALSDES